jgi:hypothetical protein
VNVASQLAGDLDLEDVEFRRRSYSGVSAYSQSKGGGLLGMASSVYAKVSGKTPEQGADTVVWLASDPEVEGESGEFWIDRRKVRCRFRDPAAEERRWALCASMTRAAG